MFFILSYQIIQSIDVASSHSILSNGYFYNLFTIVIETSDHYSYMRSDAEFTE